MTLAFNPAYSAPNELMTQLGELSTTLTTLSALPVGRTASNQSRVLLQRLAQEIFLKLRTLDVSSLSREQKADFSALAVKIDRNFSNLNHQHAFFSRVHYYFGCLVGREKTEQSLSLLVEQFEKMHDVFLLPPKIDEVPLSHAAKRQIYDYVREHLVGPDGRVLFGDIAVDLTEQQALALIRKTYDKPGLSKVKDACNGYYARIGASEKSFEDFRETIKNPEKKAERLGLDKSNSGQIYAAQIFMKEVIRNPLQSFEDANTSYERKMKGLNANSLLEKDRIRHKHTILMRNDPVQALPSSGVITPVDTILAHTHFEKAPTTIERETIKTLMQELAAEPETQHVISALGIVLRQSKGNIFIDSNTKKAYLVEKDKASFNDIGGAYTSHHSLIVCNPSSDPKYFKSVFIHETMHFLFNVLMQNNSSPVKPEEEDQASRLDTALEKDRSHRTRFTNETLLTESQGNVLASFSSLEGIGYFPEGFDAKNPKHLHTMRVEGIVRIMEQLARGATIADIQAIAPYLCTYYFRYAKPMIEEFVRSHAAFFPGFETDILKSASLGTYYDAESKTLPTRSVVVSSITASASAPSVDEGAGVGIL